MRGRHPWLAAALVVALALLVSASNWATAERTQPRSPVPQGDRVVLAIHGGAGTAVPPELEQAYRQALRASLEAGYRVIKSGGSGLDATAAAVRVMEDSDLFNAGKGAVMNTDTEHELDASIMSGRDLRGAGVTGLKHIRNPIDLARLVMDRTPHVLMAGDGAEMFARQQGVTTVPQDYFFTERAFRNLLLAKEKDPDRQKLQFGPMGTVGAVARDRAGDLAAATSTGGLTNKLVGRVGDSPILGAGTYAKNRTVAVSGTGKGESYIRTAAAHEISVLIEHARMSVRKAAETVVHEEVPATGGTGGVIALAPDGTLAAPYSTDSMIFAYVTEDGRFVIRPNG
ncbi:beta-aspartyl-peptidase (threonine type) [Herbihabitans rhizosphaerae]|uniref:Beta-aspartyl-peptidase (Threonine type) n=1 Tax=Herbihabitans rhizosphaerae TaxID=1872711 RepID=A0A4Q7KW93_9PSEU|nr:isoaspartyl peptidase/L-asparaginase [Herbihabitans rhizosphaerae]RZS40917.1 beta-aspartyl-peptidase (threonine type) [Herbihabitans rhizosphaerae]